jgi:hypothetical protein
MMTTCNVPRTQVGHVSKWATISQTITSLTIHAMTPPNNAQSSSNEGKLLLAIQAIQLGQIPSIRQAAEQYNVSRVTLSRRMNGTRSKRDSSVGTQRLTPSEEKVLVQKVLELDYRGIPIRLDKLRDFASSITEARGAPPVGSKWAYNFVKRTLGLRTRMTRSLDYRRAQSEDPKKIKEWFDVILNTKAKYGICDEDIYNFDETGFKMGQIRSATVITASERSLRPRQVQGHSQEWITVIQGINSEGWALPPFIIFKGKQYQSTWFDEDFPQDWQLSLSSNGWTTNRHGLEWLKHFDTYTKSRSKGQKRLIITDAHESHKSSEFINYCSQNNIIILWMPSHTSHILQPLDIGCFSPLKTAYSKQVEHLVKNRIYHITKVEFLPAFKKAFDQAFTLSNIQGGFRGSGIFPFNPEAVLSQLSPILRTPSPDLPDESTWEPQTPSNAYEMELQSSLLSSKVASHRDSSPSHIYQVIQQLAKGAQQMAASAAILALQVKDLEKANVEARRRKVRTNKFLSFEDRLSISKVDVLGPQDCLNPQLLQRAMENAGREGSASSSKRKCGLCREEGHTKRTCLASK